MSGSFSDEGLRWAKFCVEGTEKDGWYIPSEQGTVGEDLMLCKTDAAAGNIEAKAKMLRFAIWRLKQ